MQFEIPVVEERGKKSYIITLHLIVCFLLIVTGIFELLLHLFFSKTANAQFQHFTLLGYGGVITAIAGFVLLGLLLFKNKWLIDTKVNRIVRIIELLLFISFTVIALRYEIVYPAIIFGIACVALLYALFWESKTAEKKVVINENGIFTPKANVGTLHWYEIQHVILRFGIITIDCLDNKLFQWSIQKIDFDEEIFTEFCKAQIAANIQNRDKNW
jgi:hypothetical protein